MLESVAMYNCGSCAPLLTSASGPPQFARIDRPNANVLETLRVAASLAERESTALLDAPLGPATPKLCLGSLGESISRRRHFFQDYLLRPCQPSQVARVRHGQAPLKPLNKITVSAAETLLAEACRVPRVGFPK